MVPIRVTLLARRNTACKLPSWDLASAWRKLLHLEQTEQGCMPGTPEAGQGHLLSQPLT